MGTNKSAGKTERATAVTTIIAGARKRIPNVNQTLPVGTSTMTVAAVLGQLQAIVDNRAAVVAAQATAKAKVAAETAAMPALDAILVAFEAFIRFTFGSDPEALADFGLAPRKVPAPLSAEKAVAATKREATRKARGTTSGKPKKSVKGNVTATLVVTPAPAPAPAQMWSSPAPGLARGRRRRIVRPRLVCHNPPPSEDR